MLRLAVADVVQRLERHAADQGGVADDDGDAFLAAALVAGEGKAFGDRQAGAGVAAVEHVVRALAAPREAAHAAELAQRAELLEPAGQQLVGVGLVAGIPDDLVGRAIEQPMEGDGQLDHAERAAQVAASAGDGLDDRRPQVAAQLVELFRVHAPQVARRLDARQQ